MIQCGHLSLGSYKIYFRSLHIKLVLVYIRNSYYNICALFQFTHPMPTEMEGKLEELLQLLQEECCRDGAWVENKGVLLTFHFRNVPADKKEQLVTRASQLISGTRDLYIAIFGEM